MDEVPALVMEDGALAAQGASAHENQTKPRVLALSAP